MSSRKEKHLMWPQKGQRVFEETDKFYEFSHFGWGNIETQFYGYMSGYKESADTLVETAISSKNIRTLDTFIFLYIFKILGDKWRRKNKVIKSISHNLLSIWKYIMPILSNDCSKEELRDIEIVESYIKLFNEIDKSSFTFRYPVNKELNILFSNTKHLDLLNLKIEWLNYITFLKDVIANWIL